MANLLDALSAITAKDAPLGTGLVKQAANTEQLYKRWQVLAMQAMEQGLPFPQFAEWAQQFKQDKPVVVYK